MKLNIINWRLFINKLTAITNVINVHDLYIVINYSLLSALG